MFGRVVEFWKMAVGEPANKDSQAYYDWWLINKLSKANFSEINVFMRENVNKEWFKLDDFLPTLYKEVTSPNDRWDDVLYNDWWVGKLRQPIVKYVAERFLKENPELDPEDYAGFENEYMMKHFPDLVRKAQSSLIRNVMALFHSGSVEERDTGINILDYLMKDSNLFSKEFLWKLAKRFGVDVYSALKKMEPGKIFDKRQIFRKKELDEFDIAELYSHTKTLTIKEFLDLILKANERATEYIRGFVYSGKDTQNPFILSAEMKPMNDEYKEVKWPNIVEIHTAEEMDELDADYLGPGMSKHFWKELLGEFGVIPQ